MPNKETSAPETDKVKNIDHERLKRLPKNHPARTAIQTGLMRVLNGQATFEDLLKEQEDE